MNWMVVIASIVGLFWFCPREQLWNVVSSVLFSTITVLLGLICGILFALAAGLIMIFVMVGINLVNLKLLLTQLCCLDLLICCLLLLICWFVVVDLLVCCLLLLLLLCCCCVLLLLCCCCVVCCVVVVVVLLLSLLLLLL